MDIHGWTDRQTDGRTDKRKDRQINKHTNSWVIHMYHQTDRQTDRQTVRTSSMTQTMTSHLHLPCSRPESLTEAIRTASSLAPHWASALSQQPVAATPHTMAIGNTIAPGNHTLLHDLQMPLPPVTQSPTEFCPPRSS